MQHQTLVANGDPRLREESESVWTLNPFSRISEPQKDQSATKNKEYTVSYKKDDSNSSYFFIESLQMDL